MPFFFFYQMSLPHQSVPGPIPSTRGACIWRHRQVVTCLFFAERMIGICTLGCRASALFSPAPPWLTIVSDTSVNICRMHESSQINTIMYLFSFLSEKEGLKMFMPLTKCLTRQVCITFIATLPLAQMTILNAYKD